MSVKKKVDNRTHAQKRRAEQQSAVRAKFQGMEYVRQLEDVGKKYDELVAAMDVVVKRKAKLSKKDAEQIMLVNAQLDGMKFRLDALKAKAELNFKRLKFVLPELKAVELSDPQGNNPFATMAEALREALNSD